MQIKTRLCKFPLGKCPHGIKCNFAHGIKELECKFHQAGNCAKGNTCPYKHTPKTRPVSRHTETKKTIHVQTLKKTNRFDCINDDEVSYIPAVKALAAGFVPTVTPRAPSLSGWAKIAKSGINKKTDETNAKPKQQKESFRRKFEDEMTEDDLNLHQVIVTKTYIYTQVINDEAEGQEAEEYCEEYYNDEHDEDLYDYEEDEAYFEDDPYAEAYV